MLKLYVTMQSMFVAGFDRLHSSESKGATATEYALLVGFIAIGLVIAVTAFKDSLAGFFDKVGNVIEGWAV